MRVWVYGKDDLTKVKSWEHGRDKLIGLECIKCGAKLFTRYYDSPWGWGIGGSKLCKKCFRQRADVRRPLGFRPIKLPTPEEFRALDREVARFKELEASI